MNKHLAAVGTAAALAIGGLAVAATSPLGVAGAQDPAPTTGAPPVLERGDREGAGRAGPLDRALEGLVADGTLTEEQADAVRERTRAEAEAAREERRSRFEAHRTEFLEAAAAAIGSSPDEVGAALREGQSLASQAEAAGVDRQDVVDALVPLFTGRIDEAEADGKLTPERAEAARERVAAMVERIVDAARPTPGSWGGGGPHGGPGGPGGGAGPGGWGERLRPGGGD